VGKIWRTATGGRIWVDYTPYIEDPPNSWGDDPAPTIEDLTFIQRVDNIQRNGWHLFLAEWKNGTDEWRGWMLLTTDDGRTWQWIPFEEGVAPTKDANDYYYPVSASIEIVLPGNFPWVNAGGICGLPDENFVQGGPYSAPGSTQIELIMDMGAELTVSDYDTWFQLAGKSERDPDPGGKSPSYYDRKLYTKNPTTGAWQSWAPPTTMPLSPNGDGSYVWSPWQNQYSGLTNRKFRYCKWLLRENVGVAPLVGFDLYNDMKLYLDVFRVRLVKSITFVDLPVRPIWADVGSESGDVVWMTVWKEAPDSSTNLYLQKRSADDLTLIEDIVLGNCTMDQLDDRELFAFPMTPLGDEDTCYVAGRMSEPHKNDEETHAGIVHILVTRDGAATTEIVESGWGDDYCGAFQAAELKNGQRVLTAVRNVAGAAAELYRGADPGGLEPLPRSALPFQVNVDALTIHVRDRVAVGGMAEADGLLVLYALSPYTEWNDVTLNLPTDGEIRSLTYI
jgi:hypothetical protein